MVKEVIITRDRTRSAVFCMNTSEDSAFSTFSRKMVLSLELCSLSNSAYSGIVVPYNGTTFSGTYTSLESIPICSNLHKLAVPSCWICLIVPNSCSASCILLHSLFTHKTFPCFYSSCQILVSESSQGRTRNVIIHQSLQINIKVGVIHCNTRLLSKEYVSSTTQLQHHDEQTLCICHLQIASLQSDGNMVVPFIQNDCRYTLSTSLFCQYAYVGHASIQDEDIFIYQPECIEACPWQTLYFNQFFHSF